MSYVALTITLPQHTANPYSHAIFPRHTTTPQCHTARSSCEHAALSRRTPTTWTQFHVELWNSIPRLREIAPRNLTAACNCPSQSHAANHAAFPRPSPTRQRRQRCGVLFNHSGKGRGAYLGNLLVAIGHVGQQELAVLGRVCMFLVVAAASDRPHKPRLLLDDALGENTQPCARRQTPPRSSSSTEICSQSNNDPHSCACPGARPTVLATRLRFLAIPGQGHCTGGGCWLVGGVARKTGRLQLDATEVKPLLRHRAPGPVLPLSLPYPPLPFALLAIAGLERVSAQFLFF